MAAGIDLIFSDRKVKSLFVNIFGGITRCDEVAKGILGALEQLPSLKAPIVVRLDGTNAKKVVRSWNVPRTRTSRWRRRCSTPPPRPSR